MATHHCNTCVDASPPPRSTQARPTHAAIPIVQLQSRSSVIRFGESMRIALGKLSVQLSATPTRRITSSSDDSRLRVLRRVRATTAADGWARFDLVVARGVVVVAKGKAGSGVERLLTARGCGKGGIPWLSSARREGSGGSGSGAPVHEG